MRLWLPRALIVAVLLPALSSPAVQFRHIYNENTRAVSPSSTAQLSSWFSVSGGGLVCLLTVTTDLLTISLAQVECRNFDNSASEEVMLHTWSFYDKIGETVYSIETSLALTPASNTILHLSLCVSPVSCEGVTSPAPSCLSFPPTPTASSHSQCSSAPEGFVFAIAGPSSSSQRQETATTTTMTVEPPEIQPVVVEVSSASVPSFFSSYPEGFVMAFTPEESSSVSSTPSSQAEGFVFAFTNNNQFHSSSAASKTESSQAEGFVFAFKSSN